MSKDKQYPDQSFSSPGPAATIDGDVTIDLIETNALLQRLCDKQDITNELLQQVIDCLTACP